MARSLLDLRDELGKLLNNAGQTAGNVANYFNPNVGVNVAPPTMQNPVGPTQVQTPQLANFWTSSPMKYLANVQKTAQLVPEVQPFKGSDLISMAGNAISNIPGGMINSIYEKGVVAPTADLTNMVKNTLQGKPLPQYNELISPQVRLGYNLSGINTTPQQLIGNTAGLIEPILSAYMPKGTKEVGSQILNQAEKNLTYGQKLWQGAKTAFPMGATFGALQGAQEGRNDDLLTQLVKTGFSAGAGGIFASILGGTVAGAVNWKQGGKEALDLAKNYVRQSLTKDIQDLHPEWHPVQVENGLTHFLQDLKTGKLKGSEKSTGTVNMYRDTTKYPLTPEEIKYLSDKYSWVTNPKGGFARIPGSIDEQSKNLLEPLIKNNKLPENQQQLNEQVNNLIKQSPQGVGGGGIKVYRGTYAGDNPTDLLKEGFNKGKGLSVTTKPNIAQKYAELNSPNPNAGQVTELTINPNAKIKEVPFEQWNIDQATKLKSQGVDVVKLTYKGEDFGEHIVLNNKVLSTPPPLNQGANIGVKTPISQEAGLLGATGQKTAKNLKGKIKLTPASPDVSLNNGQSISSQQPMGQGITPSAEPLSSVKDNTRKILADQAGLKEKTLVGRMKTSEKYAPELQQMLEGKYVPKSNQETIAAAKRLVQTDAVAAEARALNPQNAVDQAIGAELFNHYMDKGMTMKANQIINATSGTNEGQMIQILSQYDKTSPAGVIKFANSAVKSYNESHPGAKLSINDAQISDLYTQAKKIQGMPEGRERNIASYQLIEKVNSMIPSSIADKAITLWKAGLLTSLRTHERNLVGNTIMSGSEIAKDAIASPIDRLLSLRTGQRSTSFTVQGVGSGAKKGFQAAKDIVTKGYDPEEAIAKFDVKHVTWGNNPIEQAAKKYTDAVFRTLGAEDKPFWNSAYARSLYDQAITSANNAGVSGDKGYIEGLVAKPTEQMIKTALKDANYATFHDSSMLSEVANAFKRAASKNEITKLGAEVLAPFTGVPSSVAGKLIDYSPIGLIKGSVNAGRVLVQNVPELQRQASQEVARGVMGTALFSLGAYLMSRGLMTGQPKDANEARQWQLENKPSNSVLVDGKWRSIGSIGPQNLILLAGAKYQEEMGKSDGSLGTYAGNVGKDFMGQTFLQGVQQPLAAINDPARYGQSYIGNQASSVIPNIVKDASKAVDPYVRENNNIGDYLRNSIPGLRNQGIIKRDALGNPIPQEPTGASAFVDLFNSKTPTHNPVVDELSRLNGVGQNATPSQLDKSQTIRKQKVTLTPEQLNNLEAGVGPIVQQQLNTLISSPAYSQLTDEAKAKAIDKVVSDVRTKYKNVNGPDITNGTAPATTISKNQSKVYSYVDENGNYKEINLSKNIETPQYTGNENLDAKLKSKYQSELTSRASDIVTLYKNNQITANEAEKMLSDLKAKSNSIKSPKKIGIRAIKVSLPKKSTMFKIAKAPTLKGLKIKGQSNRKYSIKA